MREITTSKCYPMFEYQNVEKACGKCWPKVFQNCQSTRQTELDKSFSSHTVTKWLGNSVQVARDFYLQVTDKDFDNAVEMDLLKDLAAEEAKQKARQHTAVSS